MSYFLRVSMLYSCCALVPFTWDFPRYFFVSIFPFLICAMKLSVVSKLWWGIKFCGLTALFAKLSFYITCTVYVYQRCYTTNFWLLNNHIYQSLLFSATVLHDFCMFAWRCLAWLIILKPWWVHLKSSMGNYKCMFLCSASQIIIIMICRCVGAGRSSLYLLQFKSIILVCYLNRDKGILYQMMAMPAT